MTEKQSIKEAIKHYDRMIAWAKKQNPDRKVVLKNESDSTEMQEKLGEDWYATYCPLCQQNKDICESCPYNKKYGFCGGMGKNAWFKLRLAKNYREWIMSAQKVKRQLKSLLK